jgi:hypothetical protein
MATLVGTDPVVTQHELLQEIRLPALVHAKGRDDLQDGSRELRSAMFVRGERSQAVELLEQGGMLSTEFVDFVPQPRSFSLYGTEVLTSFFECEMELEVDAELRQHGDRIQARSPALERLIQIGHTCERRVQPTPLIRPRP